MAKRFALPDDARLEQLIAEAFDRSPAPEVARIRKLGRTLEQGLPPKSGSSVNKIPWWIVLLLCGGLATAAWQGGKYFMAVSDTSDIGAPPRVEEHTAVSGNITAGGGSEGANLPDAEQGDRGSTRSEDEGPIIYQRQE